MGLGRLLPSREGLCHKKAVDKVKKVSKRTVLVVVL